MENCITFFAADSFSKDLGIKLISASQGRAKMELTITEKHLNTHRTVHGGVIYSLADAAFGVASNSYDVPSVAINTSITYMKAAKAGKLFAEVREYSKNTKLGSYIVEVYDQDGEKIALFQGLSYRKTKREYEKN